MRRIVHFNAPINALQGGKSGNKDPRNFVSGNTRGELSWDIQQQSIDRAALAREQPPQYSQARSDAGGIDGIVRTVPTRVTCTTWSKTSTALLTPILLVPKNPQRLFLQIGNPNYILPSGTPPVAVNEYATIFYSFGIPQLAGLNGFLYGHALPIVAGPRVYQGDTCPIDDVYVWQANTSGFGTVTFFYTAYEGIAAGEANQ